MILKIDSISPRLFASLTAFLASEGNIIKDAYAINNMLVGGTNKPALFATLVTSKSSESGAEHNVVLELVESYKRYETMEERRKNGNPMDQEYVLQIVPAQFLLNLVVSMGRFPQ